MLAFALYHMLAVYFESMPAVYFYSIFAFHLKPQYPVALLVVPLYLQTKHPPAVVQRVRFALW